VTEDLQQPAAPAKGGVITSVEQLLRKRGMYEIYLDHDKEPALTVHEDILVRYKLLKGAVLSAAAVDDIWQAGERHQAYTLALAYLGVKARTSMEIERYLRRREVAEERIAPVVERLIREQLVDDEDYARRFAGDRMRLQQKGSRRIQQELIQRGVAKTVAAAAVEGLDSEQEQQGAIRAAAKKWPNLKGERQDRKRKLMMFLLRRGYPHPIVRQAIAAVLEEDNIAEEGQMLDN